MSSLTGYTVVQRRRGCICGNRIEAWRFATSAFSRSGAAAPPILAWMSSDSGADVFRFRRGRSSESDGSDSPTRMRGSSSDCSVSWTERSGSRTDCSGFRVELRFPPRALQRRGFAKPCLGAETALATGRVSPEALQGAWREPGRVLREPAQQEAWRKTRKRCFA